jgi:RNA polymerase sigma-70 factor (ECF subfamily)
VKELLEQYVPRVYRFALRLTANLHAAEDLTQETMLRAWRSRRFLENSQATRVWLFRIAVNLWRDQLRRNRSAVARAGELSVEAIDPIATPDCQAADAEALRLAMESLQQLPHLQRQALYLRACEGLSAAEIASVLRTSADSVKTSLCIARKRLREQLRGILESFFVLF